MKNFERLHQELDFLKMHPRAHDQGNWVRPAGPSALEDPEVAACGTVGCLAGWAVIHTYDLVISTSQKCDCGCEMYNTSMYFRDSGEPYIGDVRQDATDIFGLTNVEANSLFAGSNTIDSMESLVKDWENNEKETTA